MLSDLAKSAIELLKLTPRYLIAVVIMAGALLFLPTPFVERIGLDGFAKDHRQWLGLAFLVSATLWGVSVVAATWRFVKRKLNSRLIKKQVVQRLSVLTEDEKQILRYYLAHNTRANMLKVDDGVVQGLVSACIIYRSASMGNILEGFAHNITDFAWDHLHENPGLLQGTTNVYRTDKRDDRW